MRYELSAFPACTLFPLLFKGVSSNRYPREIKNNTDCDELDKPDWKIESLANVTIDAWPWTCLQTRFTNHTLDLLIAPFDRLDRMLYEAASKGYIGFVQYYMEMKNLRLDRYIKADILNAAVRGGHSNVFKYFVEQKAFPVNANDAKLLLSAASGGNVDLIKYLIDKKYVAKNAISPDGTTALHAAALGGKLQAVRFFVETLNYKVNIKNANGETPAHAASVVSLPILEYLIEEKGAELDCKDDSRNTLLHSAAYYGQLDVVKYLVERKRFDIELKDNYGLTALHKATRNGKFDVVKYLADERKANLYGKDIFSLNLLHQAVIGNNLYVIKFLVDGMKLSPLIEEMNFFNRTAAMEAAKYGTLPILKYLVDEKHANTTTLDDEGCNLLHIAARENRLPTVKYLVEEKGFDVKSSLNADGRNVFCLATIHHASSSGKEDGYETEFITDYDYVIGG